MNDFWKTSETIEPGKGWPFFSPPHFLWLAICVFFIVAATISYGRCGEKGRNIWRLALGIFVEVNTVADQIFLIVTGQWNRFHLPLHLCCFGAFIVTAHAIFPKNKTLAGLTYALSMPGAVLALATPNWANLPFWNFSALLSWTFHIVLIAYPIMLIVGGGYRPSFKDMRATVPIILGAIAIIYGLNILIDTDFLFINGADSVGWMHAVYLLMGRSYIIIFVVIMAVLWTIEFLPFSLVKRHRIRAMAVKSSV